jgi:hypothetical protein
MRGAKSASGREDQVLPVIRVVVGRSLALDPENVAAVDLGYLGCGWGWVDTSEKADDKMHARVGGPSRSRIWLAVYRIDGSLRARVGREISGSINPSHSRLLKWTPKNG